MFTKLSIANAPAVPGVPARGFYVDMKYMYGDADGYATHTVGPFPREREDLLLEFANVCQGMLELYPNGKGDWDGYEDVPKYNAYFDEDYDREEEDPDQDVRESVGAETEYAPDDSGCVASLQEYRCYYCDGSSPAKYEVTLY